MQRAVVNGRTCCVCVCVCVVGGAVSRHNEATLSHRYAEMSPLSQSTVSASSRISLAVFFSSFRFSSSQ